jgi:transcriptional regulator with GAF, ATPase, and Fis domain
MVGAIVATADGTIWQTLSRSLRGRFHVTLASTHGELSDLLCSKGAEVAFVDLPLLLHARLPVGEEPVAGAFRTLQSLAPRTRIVCLYQKSHALVAARIVRDSPVIPFEYPAAEDRIDQILRDLTCSAKTPPRDSRSLGSAWPSEEVGTFETRSARMREVLDRVTLVAPRPTTVLITGETGTGKGMIARVIHACSDRSQGPFVAVHCGGVPETLIETELFGHERGAFTGAVSRKLGRFELASGGTAFLDEIGTITQTVQIKLLQVLQDRTFERVGGIKRIATDARIVVASNLDLAAMCRQGEFRSDLFYRLNVFPIHLPPLRDRLEDVPLLVDFFLRKSARPGSESSSRLEPEVLEAFMAYAWPGNLRELANLLERACILTRTGCLTRECFPAEIFRGSVAPATGQQAETRRTLAQVRQAAANRAEKEYLCGVLTANRGRIGASATAAGITPRQLHNLMKKHRLEKHTFKSSAACP